jgi:hypothetical protein
VVYSLVSENIVLKKNVDNLKNCLAELYEKVRISIENREWKFEKLIKIKNIFTFIN